MFPDFCKIEGAAGQWQRAAFKLIYPPKFLDLAPSLAYRDSKENYTKLIWSHFFCFKYMIDTLKQNHWKFYKTSLFLASFIHFSPLFRCWLSTCFICACMHKSQNTFRDTLSSVSCPPIYFF